MGTQNPPNVVVKVPVVHREVAFEAGARPIYPTFSRPPFHNFWQRRRTVKELAR